MYSPDITGFWVSVCSDPFVLGIFCFLLLLYKNFPFLFALFIDASPVVACTIVLFGILVIYSEPNIPNIEQENEHQERLRKLHYHQVKNGKPFIFEFNDQTTEASNATEGRDIGRSVFSGEIDNAAYEMSCGSSVGSCFSTDDDDEKNLNDGSEFSAENESERSYKARQLTAHHLRESSIVEPWNNIAREVASADFKYDGGDSVESNVEFVPVLDELDPLVANDGDDACSEASCPDYESNGDSMEDEAKYVDYDDSDDDEGEAEGEKTKHEVMITWTADDQRNLIILGNSELERNYKVDALIAKRRARQSLQYKVERNLINSNDKDSLLSSEELLRFQAQLPSIYAPKSNPFNLPFDSDEVPGSAPSFLVQRRGPLKESCGQAVEDGSVSQQNSSPQVSVPVPPQNIVFRRHESFTVGPSFFGDVKHESRPSRFQPYLVGDRSNSQQNSSANLSKPSIGSSSSKASPIAEPVSAQTEQQHEDINQESEAKQQVQHSHSSKEIECDRTEDDNVNESDSRNMVTEEAQDNQEKNNSSCDIAAQQCTSRSLSFAASSLASIDEIESSTKEISPIRELDVMGEELCRIRKGHEGLNASPLPVAAVSPTAPVLPSAPVLPTTPVLPTAPVLSTAPVLPVPAAAQSVPQPSLPPAQTEKSLPPPLEEEKKEKKKKMLGYSALRILPAKKVLKSFTNG